MSVEKTPCLYCHTPNEQGNENCENCGMPLAKKHPESAKTRQKFFLPFFWAIVIFCLVMMFYLPR